MPPLLAKITRDSEQPMSTVRVGVTKDSDDDAFDCSWDAIHEISAWRGSSTEECLILLEFSVAEW